MSQVSDPQLPLYLEWWIYFADVLERKAIDSSIFQGAMRLEEPFLTDFVGLLNEAMDNREFAARKTNKSHSNYAKQLKLTQIKFFVCVLLEQMELAKNYTQNTQLSRLIRRALDFDMDNMRATVDARRKFSEAITIGVEFRALGRKITQESIAKAVGVSRSSLVDTTIRNYLKSTDLPPETKPWPHYLVQVENAKKVINEYRKSGLLERNQRNLKQIDQNLKNAGN